MITSENPLYDALRSTYLGDNRPGLFWHAGQRYFSITDNDSLYFIHIPKGTPLPGDKSGRWDRYYGYTPKEPT